VSGQVRERVNSVFLLVLFHCTLAHAPTRLFLDVYESCRRRGEMGREEEDEDEP
jgi:hypothetical protein